MDLEQPDTLGTFFTRLFQADFMPHGHCFFWRGELVWLHVLSDFAIFIAYFSIPLMILHFKKNRKDLPYPWVLVLFAAFIFWCGTTHLMNIVTLWHPIYRIEGIIKMITALVSVATAILIFPLIPKALALRSPAEVEDEKKRRRELENFTHIASHDLREPLRTISLFSDLVLKESAVGGDPQAKEYLSHIKRNSDRMQSLIEDLRAYSLLEVENRSLKKISLNSCYRKALESLRVTIEESKAQITDSFPNDEMWIKGVASQVEQLFQNLISNAIKFRAPGTSPDIQISASIEKGNWLISVQDKGIGFDPQFKEHVFIFFKRLHPTSDERYPGTGMGLAICKRVVEQHGGAIWAEALPMKGATFFFKIPTAQ